MQQKISIKLLPSEAADEQVIKNLAAAASGIDASRVTGCQLLKKSLDARGRQTWYQLTVLLFIDEPFQPAERIPLHLQDVHQSPRRVIIAGAGPAGLFAALRLIELGIKPVILERGKDVRARRRDLAAMNKEGKV